MNENTLSQNDAASPMELGATARWLDLAAMGLIAWNAWAEEELKKPPNERAKITFSDQELSCCDWAKFIIPGSIRFKKVTISSDTSFVRATFHGPVTFEEVISLSKSGISFAGCSFHAGTFFLSCSFSGIISFDHSTFHREVTFNGSTFGQAAHLSNTVFFQRASLRNVHFEKSVHFRSSDFRSDVDFQKSFFLSDADFIMVKFAGLVDFSRTKFMRPPDFSTSTFEHDISFNFAQFDYHKAIDSQAKYRNLKRFAVASHDNHSELDLFANELKSRRQMQLSWSNIRDWPEKCTSIIYEISSDYGRSVIRPFVFLLLIFCASSYQFARLSSQPYLPWLWHSAVWVAAGVNLVPLVGQIDVGRRASEYHICPPLQNNLPNTECQLRLYGISAIEGLLALVALFLLALGLRNLFKIK